METSHSFPSEESGTNLARAFGNGNCRVVLYAAELKGSHLRMGAYRESAGYIPLFLERLPHRISEKQSPCKIWKIFFLVKNTMKRTSQYIERLEMDAKIARTQNISKTYEIITDDNVTENDRWVYLEDTKPDLSNLSDSELENLRSSANREYKVRQKQRRKLLQNNAADYDGMLGTTDN